MRVVNAASIAAARLALECLRDTAVAAIDMNRGTGGYEEADVTLCALGATCLTALSDPRLAQTPEQKGGDATSSAIPGSDPTSNEAPAGSAAGAVGLHDLAGFIMGPSRKEPTQEQISRLADRLMDESEEGRAARVAFARSHGRPVDGTTTPAQEPAPPSAPEQGALPPRPEDQPWLTCSRCSQQWPHYAQMPICLDATTTSVRCTPAAKDALTLGFCTWCHEVLPRQYWAIAEQEEMRRDCREHAANCEASPAVQRAKAAEAEVATLRSQVAARGEPVAWLYEDTIMLDGKPADVRVRVERAPEGTPARNPTCWREMPLYAAPVEREPDARWLLERTGYQGGFLQLSEDDGRGGWRILRGLTCDAPDFAPLSALLGDAERVTLLVGVEKQEG